MSTATKFKKVRLHDCSEIPVNPQPRRGPRTLAYMYRSEHGVVSAYSVADATASIGG